MSNRVSQEMAWIKAPSIFSRRRKRFLSFQKLLGVEEYPAKGSFNAFLRPAVPPQKNKPATGKKTPAPSPKPTGDLQVILESMVGCEQCLLHKGRKNIITGKGPVSPQLMVIGDWPGPDDDQTGSPFQGPEGEMLANMLKAIKLSREGTYITTLVKCHPPNNRPPTKEEIATCLPYLFQQISAIAPKTICAMGPLATQTLLQTDQRLVQLRGRFHDCHSIPLMPTFHPSFLLKNPEMKKATWRDLLLIQKKLEQ